MAGMIPPAPKPPVAPRPLTVAPQAPATPAEAPVLQWASIYAHTEGICVQTCSGFARAAHDLHGRTVFTSFQAGPAALGEGLRAVLAASRVLDAAEQEVFFASRSLGENYRTWIAQVQAGLGLPSRQALFHGLRHCVVTRTGSTLRIRPTRHDPANPESWSAEGIGDDQTVLVPDRATAEAVGQAVLLAIGRCT